MRRSRFLIVLLVLLVMLGIIAQSSLLPQQPQTAYAATIIVDGTTCTLTDAILSANNENPSGGCIAGSGTETIVLNANVSRQLLML